MFKFKNFAKFWGLKEYQDFIVESFRRGYCERYIIQARSEKEAEMIALNDFNIYPYLEKGGNGYFVFDSE